MTMKVWGQSSLGEYTIECDGSPNTELHALQQKLIQLHGAVLEQLETLHHTKDFHDDVQLQNYFRVVDAGVDRALQDFEDYYEAWSFHQPEGYVHPEDEVDA